MRSGRSQFHRCCNRPKSGAKFPRHGFRRLFGESEVRFIGRSFHCGIFFRPERFANGSDGSFDPFEREVWWSFLQHTLRSNGSCETFCGGSWRIKRPCRTQPRRKSIRKRNPTSGIIFAVSRFRAWKRRRVDLSMSVVPGGCQRRLENWRTVFLIYGKGGWRRGSGSRSSMGASRIAAVSIVEKLRGAFWSGAIVPMRRR